jgi:hypothetical protein
MQASVYVPVPEYWCTLVLYWKLFEDESSIFRNSERADDDLVSCCIIVVCLFAHALTISVTYLIDILPSLLSHNEALFDSSII